MDDARLRIDMADGVGCGQGRPHKLGLELHATPGRRWVEQCHVAAGPCPEGNLIYRAVVWSAGRLVAHERRDVARKGGEAFDEFRRPDIDVVRPSIMAQVPNGLHSRTTRRSQHINKARPIVLTRRLFDQVPAQAVAYGCYAMSPQYFIVAQGIGIVMSRFDEVQAPAVPAPVGGTFKSTQEKTIEKLRHVPSDGLALLLACP